MLTARVLSAIARRPFPMRTAERGHRSVILPLRCPTHPIGVPGGIRRSVLAPSLALSRRRAMAGCATHPVARRHCYLVGGPLAALSRLVHVWGGRACFEGRYGALIRHLINAGEPHIEIRSLLYDTPCQARHDITDLLPVRLAVCCSAHARDTGMEIFGEQRKSVCVQRNFVGEGEDGFHR